MIFIKILFNVSIAEANEKIDVNAETHNIRGIKFFKNGEIDAALKEFNAAIKVDPTYIITYGNRGKVYEAKKQYKLALKDYNKLIELSPLYAKSYFNRGNAYEKMNQFDLAIKDYSKAIDLNPGYAKAFENRGIINWVKLRKKVQACLDLKKACELNRCKAYNIIKSQGLCP